MGAHWSWAVRVFPLLHAPSVAVLLLLSSKPLWLSRTTLSGTYPSPDSEGYAVLSSVLSPPNAALWRALFTAREAYSEVARALGLSDYARKPFANATHATLTPSPMRDEAVAEDWEVEASRRARPFASRVTTDGISRLFFTHPPTADGQKLFICVVPCDAYHRRYCAGARLGSGHDEANSGVVIDAFSTDVGETNWRGSYEGHAAVWLAVWHPCVWRSEAVSYTHLTLPTKRIV